MGLPPGYAIRPATAEDLPLLPAIERGAARLFAPFDAGETEDVDVSADLALTSAALAAGRLWVAVFGTRVVGFALATIIDGEAHLHEMDVLPDHGRRGLGRALVAALRRWTVARGLPAITLSTRQDVPFNGPFYVRLGFTVAADEQLTPGLRRLRRQEQRRGLDVSRRAIMRLALPRAS